MSNKKFKQKLLDTVTQKTRICLVDIDDEDEQPTVGIFFDDEPIAFFYPNDNNTVTIATPHGEHIEIPDKEFFKISKTKKPMHKRIK